MTGVDFVVVVVVVVVVAAGGDDGGADVGFCEGELLVVVLIVALW